MKLIPRAAVYWRIGLLFRNSERFFRTLEIQKEVHTETLDALCEEFRLATNEIERKVARDILNFLITNKTWENYQQTKNQKSKNIKADITMTENADITLTIHAPISREEYEDLWDDLKLNQELRFQDSRFLIEEMLPLGRKSVNKKELETLFQEYRKKHKGVVSYREALKWVGKDRHPWKFKPIPSLDDDLEIYSIRKKYKNYSDAEEHYKKLMLERYLLKNKEKEITFEVRTSFSEAVAETVKQFPDLNRFSHGFERRIKIKDFRDRLEEFEKHWGI